MTSPTPRPSPSKRPRPRAALLLAAALLAPPVAASASRDGPADAAREDDRAETAVAVAECKPAVVLDDGAWCWFADPRALALPGDPPRTVFGAVASDGDLVLVELRADGSRREHVLHERFERDDHASPGLALLSDGRLAVFYSRHADDALRVRVTLRPGDLTAWRAERELRPNPPPPGGAERTRTAYCYANPQRLTAEGRLYLFWRGTHWKPCFATSPDDGATWSEGRILFAEEGSGPDVRPYLKVAGDGERRLAFALTDGHPRNEPQNAIRFAVYEAGRFRTAAGEPLGDLEHLPLAPSRLETVYDGSEGRAWIWDVALDAHGRPAIAYTRLPAERDHRYRWARFDGERWVDRELCAGESWFPQTPEGAREGEPHYSGGLALDPADPDTVYLSRQSGGVRSIERWRTQDLGATWVRTRLAGGSHAPDVRPVVVRGHRTGTPEVLWMRLTGRYRHYTDYATAILAWPQPGAE